MKLQEKISQLVRYCSQYQSHGYMMDERNMDEDFNVELPEERKLRQCIDRIHVILMTGEAGDGKSRLLRNIGELLKEKGFSEPCSDFSALPPEEKKELIIRLKNVLAGKSGEKLVILANVGIFTQAVLKEDIRLMEELTARREDVFICNFEKRNLAEDESSFRNIVQQFLACDPECSQSGCLCYEACPFRENIKKLQTEEGIQAIRVICDAIYLIGGHITFRELLSLLAYIVTFGEDCKERQKLLEDCPEEKRAAALERKRYYAVFEKNSDILLSKVSDMDPSLKRGMYPQTVTDRTQYIRYRRKAFFEPVKEGRERYEMLNADYLVEYYEVLRHIHRPPYYYDTAIDKNPILQKLKRGINRMCNQGKGDSGLIVTDSPSIFDKSIRTEFLVIQDIRMIWHRYDLQLKKGYQPDGHLWNKFYLSCMTGQKDEKKLISLLIDYRQFCHLMMCSDDYFTNRNGLTVEEYSVNTFYRKVLEEKEHSYDSIVIRFDKRQELQNDFSLKIHTQEDLFTEEKRQSIIIKKED